MIKDKTIITLDPEDILRLHAILLDEDKDAPLDFLAAVIKKKTEAAPHVVSLADKYQAMVIMLYVGTDLTAFWGGYAQDPGEHHLQRFQEWELKQAKSKMQTICDTDLKACPNLEIKLVQGEAAAEILKVIQDDKADLVVITTHGQGHDQIDQKSPVFGSVADKVIRISPVPVRLVNFFKEG